MRQSWYQRWRGSSVWLGLSVNDQSLTLVEGAHLLWPPAAGQRWSQASWAPAQPPTSFQGPEGLSDPLTLGAAVRSAWQRAGMRCRRLAMGVPADRVVQQSLQVDADVPVHEVRDQVQWSASQALALAWDEVAFDVRIEPASKAQGTEWAAQQTVHWLACPLAWVQGAQQMSRVAQLRLQFFGVEPLDVPWTLEGMADAAQPPPLQWHRARDMACQAARA